MKKSRTAVIVLLLVGLVAIYLIVNKFKPPVQHVTMKPAAPSQPYGYDVPVQADSPWPTFRRDRRNTGSSPLIAIYWRSALVLSNWQGTLYNSCH